MKSSELYNIKYQPKNNIAYINNPKAACTTIKNSLLYGEVDEFSSLHEQSAFPILREKRARDAMIPHPTILYSRLRRGV